MLTKVECCCVYICGLCVFFKQKTAYEMRISYWSSDVCSSDLSAEGLKTLFRQVRQALAVRGQRLVLLLEDITSWEGIDDSLIDVLVTNAGTRDDMCPLISVVGVTPAYYQKLHGYYRGRITHELSRSEERGGGKERVRKG